ncbi:MAG: FIST N-terminal domain-containing protein, partial [Planctomycetota bacterium]|nr:FIST N-terminal domain-containing protein [Planctomycetota bacterium]
MTAEAGESLKFAAASSDHHKLESAIENVCSEIEAQFAGRIPDFALLFVSSPHIFQQRNQLSKLVASLIERLGTSKLIGCSGSGVIGDGKEFEQEAAVSLFAGAIPGANIQSFYCNEIDRRRWKSAGDFAEQLPIINSDQAPVFLLSDPFTFNIEEFLAETEQAFPAARMIGGLASGPGAPGLNVLFHGADIKNNGAVGLQVEGDFDFRSVVSQGCRPIGRPGIITKSKGNIISSIRGQSPLKELEHLISESDESEREL